VTTARWPEGRIERTVPLIFSGDDFMDIGNDTGAPVTGVGGGHEWATSRSMIQGGGGGRWVKLEDAQALWESDCLTREELPEVAADALMAGLDSPSLRLLRA
jgi:hypothetical protein